MRRKLSLVTLTTLLGLSEGRGTVLLVVVVHGVAVGLLMHHVSGVSLKGRGELISGANQETFVGQKCTQSLQFQPVILK